MFLLFIKKKKKKKKINQLMKFQIYCYKIKKLKL